jgi:hypothetical protein
MRPLEEIAQLDNLGSRGRDGRFSSIAQLAGASPAHRGRGVKPGIGPSALAAGTNLA